MTANYEIWYLPVTKFSLCTQSLVCTLWYETPLFSQTQSKFISTIAVIVVQLCVHTAVDLYSNLLPIFESVQQRSCVHSSVHSRLPSYCGFAIF
jgi:hypothetical protein